MSNWLVSIGSLLYLALLFALASWAENRKGRYARWLQSPYVYALSLAVYCSAWTYYGSVGRASDYHLDYLAIYLGPTLAAPLFGLVLRKMIRVSKVQRVNTLADFISARYGKKILLGNLVAIFCAIGIIPYIALQIKAIAISFDALVQSGNGAGGKAFFFSDAAFYFTIILGAFIILYATRRISDREENTGLVVAIAFESVVKLLVFMLLGLAVWLFLPENLAPVLPELTLNEGNSPIDWMGMLALSGAAFFLLPRQFEMGVVANVHESHLNKAIWLFPLYLFLINLFVFPIAEAGNLLFQDGAVAGDIYVLAIPIAMNQSALAFLVYIGGFSAASGMIIVSTMALSKMLSTNLLIPYVVQRKAFQRWGRSGALPAYSRRFFIVVILLLAYVFYAFFTEGYSLISIGLISFVAVSQFAPAVFGGLYWKQGSYRGAVAGITAGFIVWGYTLILPSTLQTFQWLPAWMENGPFGLAWLHPHRLLGVDGLSPVVHAFFWSLLVNGGLYAWISLRSQQTPIEINQAEIFVDIFSYNHVLDNTVVWKGTAYIPDIRTLLERFLGPAQAEQSLHEFEDTYQVQLSDMKKADARLVSYAEKLLSGIIGAASARLVVGSVVKEDKITVDEVVEILKESQELLKLNKDLKRTTDQLRAASRELKKANLRLKQQDELKDEFLYTVTHEMRTPLTSIKALSEIIHDNPDLPEEQRTEYLASIVRETDRMTRLISQVLDLEKFESGKNTLDISRFSVNELLQECLDAMSEVIRQRNIQMQLEIPPNLPMVNADRDRVIQVVQNLLSNAVKFCDPEKGIILISAYPLEDMIKINVADNGRGVAEEQRKVIFEKFYQAKDQTVRKPQGSGLGLAICKKIAMLHRGEIWVETSRFGGARFSFTLPKNARAHG